MFIFGQSWPSGVVGIMWTVWLPLFSSSSSSSLTQYVCFFIHSGNLNSLWKRKIITFREYMTGSMNIQKGVWVNLTQTTQRGLPKFFTIQIDINVFSKPSRIVWCLSFIFKSSEFKSENFRSKTFHRQKSINQALDNERPSRVLQKVQQKRTKRALAKTILHPSCSAESFWTVSAYREVILEHLQKKDTNGR